MLQLSASMAVFRVVIPGVQAVAQQGFLLIADITGYTMFLTRSELEHAQGILDTLFKSIRDGRHGKMDAFIGKLSFVQIRALAVDIYERSHKPTQVAALK